MSPTMPASRRWLNARRSDDCSTWTTAAPSGKWLARGVPDVLEERSAQEQHEIDIAQRRAHLPRIARQRLPVIRMAGREGRVVLASPSNHTEAPIASESATSACSAPDRATSSPAMIAGLLDFRSSDASASTPSGSGGAERHNLSGAEASIEVSCSSTSIGSETNTGPCGASVATLKARRRIGLISSARSICTLHLVTGAAIATRSWPSRGLLSRIRVSCWPAVTTTGEHAFNAP